MKLIMWFVRLFVRTGALINRTLDQQIVESDLAVGNYEVVSTKKGQFIRNHRLYEHKTIVKRGEKKSWVVLSEKSLLPRFSVVKDGLTNKVLLAPQKK